MSFEEQNSQDKPVPKHSSVQLYGLRHSISREILKYAKENPKISTSEASSSLPKVEITSSSKTTPANSILNELGSSNISQEKIEKAIATAGGEKQFYNLLYRIASYDTLPPSLQHLIKAGGNDVSFLSVDSFIPNQTNLPSHIKAQDVVELLAKKSSKDLRHNLTVLQTIDWPERVKTLRDNTLKQMSARLGDTNPEALHDYLIVIRDPSRGNNSSNQIGDLGDHFIDKRVKEKVTNRDHQLSKLSEVTKNKVNTFAKLLPFLSEDTLSTKQSKLVNEVDLFQKEIRQEQGALQRYMAAIQALDLSSDVRKQLAAVAGGHRLAGDNLMLQLADEHGTAVLKTFAPDTYQALTGVWERLYQRGVTNTPLLPNYSLGRPEVLSEALETLRSAKEKKSFATLPAYASLQHHVNKFLVDESFRAIDTHPAILQATKAAADLAIDLPVLEKLFHAGMSGTRGNDFVRYVREQGTELGMTIDKLQENTPALCEAVKELSEARKQVIDSRTQEGLDKRIKALNELITTLSPDSKQVKELRAMCHLIESGDFDKTNLWRELLAKTKDVAVMAATATAIVTTCGTSTPLAAIGTATLISSSGLAFKESWAETCYQLGWTGNSGSQLGDSLRGLKNDGHLIYDPVKQTFVSPPTVADALKNYGFTITSDTLALLSLGSCGRLVHKGLTWANNIVDKSEQKEAVSFLNDLLTQSAKSTTAFEEAIKGLPSHSQAVWRTFLRQCSNQIRPELIDQINLTKNEVKEKIQSEFDRQNFLMHLVTCAADSLPSDASFNHFPTWLSKNQLQLPMNKAAFLKNLKSYVKEDLITHNLKDLPDGLETIVANQTLKISFLP